MSIGGVMVFDPLPGGRGPTVEEVCANLAARLGSAAALLAAAVRRPEPADSRGRAGSTTSVSTFATTSLTWRCRRPAGEAELCDWAADFYSHRLDRTRPLWEMALIEGLEDGRWALAHKTHHCLVDGVGSVDVAYLLLDTEPNPPERRASRRPPRPARRARSLWRARAAARRSRSPRPPTPAPLGGRAGVHAAAASARSARALALARRADRPRRDDRRAPHVAERSDRLDAAVRGRRAPAGRAEGDQPRARRIGQRRRARGLHHRAAAPAARARRAAPARGPAGDGPDERPPELASGSTLGNRVSSLFVELPVAEAGSAHARHRQIVASTGALEVLRCRRRAQTRCSTWRRSRRRVLHAALARTLYATRLFNVTITNVPGPQIPLYAFGAQLREIHPFVPLAAEHAVGIAIFSYNGTGHLRHHRRQRIDARPRRARATASRQGSRSCWRCVPNANHNATIEQVRF